MAAAPVAGGPLNNDTQPEPAPRVIPDTRSIPPQSGRESIHSVSCAKTHTWKDLPAGSYHCALSPGLPRRRMHRTQRLPHAYSAAAEQSRWIAMPALHITVARRRPARQRTRRKQPATTTAHKPIRCSPRPFHIANGQCGIFNCLRHKMRVPYGSVHNGHNVCDTLGS